MMALGAMANHPNLQVKILPVGLSYFHPHRFRSRAVVEFGSTLDVPAEFVEMYKEGGTKKREAVAKLLDLVYDALKTVTIRAPDYDTLMVISLLQHILYSLILNFAANTSSPTIIQDPWTAFNVRSSR
jgi:glycerol-3-phosphate O-acyltransferase/dihydroxyacetone phosphate acyltransferase